MTLYSDLVKQNQLTNDLTAISASIQERLAKYASSNPGLLYCCDAEYIGAPSDIFLHRPRKAGQRVEFIDTLVSDLEHQNGSEVFIPGLVLLDTNFLSRTSNGIVVIDQHYLTREQYKKLDIPGRPKECLAGKCYSIFSKQEDLPEKETLEHYFDTYPIDGDVVRASLDCADIPWEIVPLPVSPYEGIAEFLVVEELHDFYALSRGIKSEDTPDMLYGIYGPKPGFTYIEDGFVREFLELVKVRTGIGAEDTANIVHGISGAKGGFPGMGEGFVEELAELLKVGKWIGAKDTANIAYDTYGATAGFPDIGEEFVEDLAELLRA